MSHHSVSGLTVESPPRRSVSLGRWPDAVRLACLMLAATSFNTREHVVAVTLETTWNAPNSTISGYETVGRQLGLALERYLKTNPRQDN